MKFRMWHGCDRGLCCKAAGRQDRQLNTYDWLADVPGNAESTDLVEVQFKNTRKGYYHNVNNLDLKKGDVVAVEASPGHDIGVVTLTGRLVKLQIKKANLKSSDDIKRIYRIAKPVDIEKCKEAKSREHGTMIQSRQHCDNNQTLHCLLLLLILIYILEFQEIMQMRVRQDRAFARVVVSLLVRNHHLARIAHVHSHQRDLETGDVGTQHRAVNTVGRRRQQVGRVDADTSARKQLILHVDSRRNQRRQVALRRRTVGKVMNQHIGVAVKLRYHLLIVRCAVGICARLLL